MSFPEKPQGRARRAARSVLLQVSSSLDSAAAFQAGALQFDGHLLPLALPAHRGAEAAAEFQKIVEHRGILVSDPIGGLAFPQLARAYSISGDRTRAKSAYGDFLKLWKSAEPEIPVLEPAKAEYAKVQ